MTLHVPPSYVSRKGPSAAVAMTLGFLQAMIAGLKFEKRRLVTAVLDLSGYLSGVGKLKEKIDIAKGDDTTHLVMSAWNKDQIDRGLLRTKDTAMEYVGVRHLGGVLHYLLVGGNKGKHFSCGLRLNLILEGGLTLFYILPHSLCRRQHSPSAGSNGLCKNCGVNVGKRL